jgi:hypothetical protein
MENKNFEFKNTGLKKNMASLRSALLIKAASKMAKPSVFIKLIPVYAVAFAMAATALYMRIDYNETNGNLNELGGVWCTYQGGSSVVWPPASKKGENSFVKSAPGSTGKGYAIRITGTAGTQPGSDFIGVNTFLSPHSTCPECIGIDLTKFTGIKFKIKGTVPAGQVLFMLPHEAREADSSRGICRSLTSYADYEADITRYITSSWKEVRINFRKDLRQPAWAKQSDLVPIEDVLSDANIIKWHYRNGGGHSIDIWIDKLEFY